MDEVLKFLTRNPIFFFTTMDGDQPRVRPFGAVTKYEGKLYFITSNQKEVYRQLKINPKVEICGIDQNENWLRISGKAVMDTRPETVGHMLEEMPSLKNIYSVDDGIAEVFYLTDAEARFCTMGK